MSKRKYVNSLQADWSFDDLMKDIEYPIAKPDLEKCDQAYIFTEDRHIIQGFLYLHEGKPFVIPEPEPSILYFTNAERNLENILNIRLEIFNSIGIKSVPKVDLLFSEFYLLSFIFVINLFASLEAFNNCVIPSDFTYRDKKRLLDRDNIQRYAKFDLKVKKIIPAIFGKSFVVGFNKKYELLVDLKEFRDNLIHTKNFSKNWQASYRDIYRGLLDFDFENSYNYSKDYMNYYKLDWIEKHEI